MKRTGKKSKMKQKKKTVDAEMSWKEAVLAYQINIKEKTLEDIRYEVKILEDDKIRLAKSNDSLKQEQVFLMEDLLKVTKVLEKNDYEITKAEVIAQMKDNWSANIANELALEELKTSLFKKNEEILLQQQLIEYWKDYKNRGQHEQEKQICLLQGNKTDMQETFELMSGFMLQSMVNTKQVIEKNTVEIIDQHKNTAAERAIANMDTYSKREVIDNDWLLHEIEIHRTETAELFLLVEKLEQGNLQILNELFECQMEDLQASRSFFKTQFSDAEDLQETRSVLDIDLTKLKEKYDLYLHSTDDVSNYFDCQDSIESLHLSDCSSNELLELGPLEMKYLNVAGTKLYVHKPNSPSYDKLKAEHLEDNDWPVTRPMLLDAFHHRHKEQPSVI